MTRRQVPLLALAGVAAAATAWYLSHSFPTLLPNLAAALLILALPMIFWLPNAEFVRIALAWTVGGLMGAYIFGVFVLLAGVVAATVLTARRYLRRPGM